MARSQFFIFIASLLFSSLGCYALETSNANVSLNIAKIQKLTGETGQLDQDQKIYKITVPRDDLKILISGMQMTPDMGLSSWIAFKKTDNQTSVNGDLILLQDQINPVMSVALTNGLQVTGLHNPYLWDSPRVMFMHITGEGDELQLASAIGQVLKKIKATSNGGGDFPLGNFDFLRTTLDAHKIDVILGQKGQFKDDVYKIEFGDGVKATDTEVNKVIALNTWAAFAGSDSEAVVNGTIVLHESELQKALVKLRNAQIYVLAIYQNMINAERDLVLINFWGVGNTQNLARTLRSVFVIAQNSNPANITVGEILPDISPANMEIEIGAMPVQLSLYKNDNCGYAKAKELYTSIDTIENINVDYAKQLGETLRMALNLTQKIVSEKVTEFVNFLPAASEAPTQAILSESRAIERQIFPPSARMIIAQLSVVENNNLDALSRQPLLALLQPVVSEQVSSAVLSKAQKIKNVSANLHADLVSAFLSTYIYTYKNEFVTFYTTIFTSLSHIASTSAVRVCTHINQFRILSANLFQSVTNAVYATVAHVYTDINQFRILSVNMSKSFVHAVSAAVVHVHSNINESAILSFSMFQSVANSVSVAVAQVYGKNINAFALSSISVSKSIAHAASVAVVRDTNALAALSVNVSQSFDYAIFSAVSRLNRHINEFALLSVSVSKSLAHATSFILSKEITQPSNESLVIVAEAQNKIPGMIKSLEKIISPMSLSPLALPISASTPVATVHVAQKKEVDTINPVKNKLTNIAQATPKAGSLTSFVEAGLSQPEKTVIKAQPVSAIVVSPGQSHDKIKKSLSAVLPVAQHKVIAASSEKILPASLPMPQHKVIRVATLSTLSSVLPVTRHTVKAVPVMQHKIIKVTKLSPKSLPPRHSIKNHNAPRVKSMVKPSASFVHTKTVKHREQLNKELSVTLHTAHNKHARYVLNKPVIYPVAHNINSQPLEKITKKPHEIGYAMPHEENWNAEKLAPEPQPPVRVAQQHVYHTQEEFDDGPAVVGAYPYDEEPTSDGFGG